MYVPVLDNKDSPTTKKSIFSLWLIARHKFITINVSNFLAMLALSSLTSYLISKCPYTYVWFGMFLKSASVVSRYRHKCRIFHVNKVCFTVFLVISDRGCSACIRAALWSLLPTQSTVLTRLLWRLIMIRCRTTFLFLLCTLVYFVYIVSI